MKRTSLLIPLAGSPIDHLPARYQSLFSTVHPSRLHLDGVSGWSIDSDLTVSKFRCVTKPLQSTRISGGFSTKNAPGAPLMTFTARTSFGCCGAISVEDFSLETAGASWVWVVSVRAKTFALGRLRGTARRRDILQLSVTQAALRGESEGVDANSHACYIPVCLNTKTTSIGL